jgi:hypothetical protein
METVDFFERCNEMMFNLKDSKIGTVESNKIDRSDKVKKATGFNTEAIDESEDDEFAEFADTEESADEFADAGIDAGIDVSIDVEETSTDVSADVGTESSIKLIQSVPVEYVVNNLDNFMVYAVTYVAHGDVNAVLDVWNKSHTTKGSTINNLDDFLVAFAYEHFAVELNIAEVRSITVQEVQERFLKSINQNEVSQPLEPEKYETDEISDNKLSQVELQNKRKFALLSMVVGNKHDLAGSFNKYAMQLLLSVYKYPLRYVADDIGDVILFKTPAGFKIMDTVQFLAGDMKVPKFKALAVQELNEKAGLLFYEATDTTIDAFMDFSQKSESSFTKWAKTDMRLSKGCDRWNLVRLIHSIKDQKAKKRLFSLFDVPFLDYWKLDRAISYCLDKFPEFKDVMQGDDVIEKLLIMSKYTHIESRTVFLLRFLEGYLGQKVNNSIRDLKKIDCSKITVNIDGKRQIIDLRSFIAGITAYKELYGTRLRIQIENNDEICVIA